MNITEYISKTRPMMSWLYIRCLNDFYKWGCGETGKHISRMR